MKLRVLVLVVVFLAVTSPASAASTPQVSNSVLYVPLIGLTSVPSPWVLPKGPGKVTYSYAVKNFLLEVPLGDVRVVDDKCEPIKFVTGDDNGNSMLDYNETWRYSCTTELSETTQSTAIATGVANNMTALHKAYSTVVVGSNNPAPVVSIINITKVAYPLSLPVEGGNITFTYKVNNPGVVPLGDVTVTDDKCKAMSGKLGDTNGNNLLDIHEVWIYTCTAVLKQTTTNTVNVMAYANGLKAVDNTTITVKVAQSNIALPNTGVMPNIKIIVWGVLVGILTGLTVVYIFIGKKH